MRRIPLLAMYPRGPDYRPIELHGSSFLHPFVKTFLLIISIGAIAGSGYFLARSPFMEQWMVRNRAEPAQQVASASISEAPQPVPSGNSTANAATISQMSSLQISVPPFRRTT